MIGLIRSEAVKAVSTKMWWILFVVAAGLTVLSTLPLILLSGTTDPSSGTAIADTDLTDPGVMTTLWSTMGSGQIIALILGILSFTGEYRHGTITDTFLTEPRRAAVIVAKAVVNAGLGVLLAVVTAGTVALMVVLLLPSRPHAPIDWSYVAGIALVVALTYMLYAVLGVAVGALITNQIAAIVIALLWVMLIESLIVAFLPDVGKWLPGGAASGVLNVQSYDGRDLLPQGLAVLVLVGYTLVFAVAAAFTTLRRDIT